MSSQKRVINRELSQLAFNRRVLHQTLDPDVPLLERLRFLCIASQNMDEFFEVRIAALRQRLALGLQSGSNNSNGHPSELLDEVSTAAHTLIAEQYFILNTRLIPELEDVNIRFLRRSNWNKPIRDWVSHYYRNELEPVLSPIGLDPAHPFPRILNKSLNFLVTLSGRDAFGRATKKAVVQAPRALPRLVQLPRSLRQVGNFDFVFLSSIIHAHVASIFPGMMVRGCYQFRVTRDSELYLDEEEIEDLLQALHMELGTRRYSAAVRLEITKECPRSQAEFLLNHFELEKRDLYRVDGPVNLGRLMTVVDMVDRQELKWPHFKPSVISALREDQDYFQSISREDYLLHHPYQSFGPILEFLRQAARDPRVLAIKQTLYRTGARSPIVDLLVEAASSGKEVTVVIELRARFDEADNIDLASRLQDAGAHVVYGVVGFKTHAKMLMVVRKETAGIRRYVHLSTGNYHPDTANLYCDYGLLTADADIGADVHRVFMELTGLGHSHKLNVLLQAPFTMRAELLSMIETEANHCLRGGKGRIVAKLNALTEPSVIEALYHASQCGVQVDLLVRGMCSLRPRITGLSEHIQVRSIIGRFLEHSRIYYFRNNGNGRLYLSSADWMERNLLRRVEIAFPIKSPRLRRRLLSELALYLRDNRQAWILQANGTYLNVHPRNKERTVIAQQVLLNKLTNTGNN